MKKHLYIITALLALLVMSCEDYSIETPSVNSVTISEQVVNVDGTVTVQFLFNANATHDVVIWWGFEGSNYQEYTDAISNPGSSEENITKSYSSGESLNDAEMWNGTVLFEKTYPAVGTYDLVVVATNIGDFGNDVKQTTLKQTITIQ